MATTEGSNGAALSDAVLSARPQWGSFIHGAFLTEWGFTAECLEEAMVEVRDRAVRCLGDRLSHGVLNG